MNNELKAVQLYNDILVIADINGNIIKPIDNQPNYGLIELEQKFLIFKNERMINSQKKTIIIGLIEDLIELKWNKNTKLDKNKHQIIYEEEAYIGSDEEIINNLTKRGSIKRAWENGPILRKDGCPIILRSYFTTDMSVKSKYIEHDNWDEIQEYIFINQKEIERGEIKEYKDGKNGELLFYQATMRFDNILNKYIQAYKYVRLFDTIEKLKQLNLQEFHLFNIICKEFELGDGIEEYLLPLYFYESPSNASISLNNARGSLYTSNKSILYYQSYITTDQSDRDIVVHKKDLDITIDVVNLDGLNFSFTAQKAYRCVRKVKRNGEYRLFFSPAYFKRFYNQWFENDDLYFFKVTSTEFSQFHVGKWYKIKKELFQTIDESIPPLIMETGELGVQFILPGNVMEYVKSITENETVKSPLFKKLFLQKSILKSQGIIHRKQEYQEDFELEKIEIKKTLKPEKIIQDYNFLIKVPQHLFNHCAYFAILKYYPKKYKDSELDYSSIEARKNILSFKNGKNTDFFVDMFYNAMSNEFNKDFFIDKVFLIIPAASKERTYERFFNFLNSISNKFGAINGYEHLTNNSLERTPSTLGGTRKKDLKNYLHVDANLNNKDVVIFDDVRTTGSSSSQIYLILKEIGVKDIVFIYLAKTSSLNS